MQGEANEYGWMDTVPQEDKVAIIIPLYGFWSDVSTQELTAQVLQAALFRIKSMKHKAYYIFVHENQRLSKDVKDIIIGKYQGGNVLPIETDAFSTYAEYLETGLESALQDTDAKFLVVVNPWVILRENAIDNMLERINKSDVSIVSGFDMRTYEHSGVVGVPAEQLDSFEFTPPVEMRDFNFDFWGLTRQMAEILKIDVNYRTHYFLSRDIWQASYQKGLEVVSSQFFPIFSLEVSWPLLESPMEHAQDMKLFMDKWKFDPQIKYTNET